MFDNKVILVTGGTGSFGKEFIRFVIKNYKFKKIIIFSRDELKQHEFRISLSDKELKKVRFFIRKLYIPSVLMISPVKIDAKPIDKE